MKLPQTKLKADFHCVTHWSRFDDEWPVDRTVAYCLDFAHRENATKTLMDCAIDNSRIVVFYDGDRKYLSEFLTTLQGMSRIK